MLSRLSKLSLGIIFGGVLLLPSDAETPVSEGSTPTPTHITTSRPSSHLLSRLKQEVALARKEFKGEIKFPNSVDLQSLVDVLAEQGMMASLRSSSLLYRHRSS